MQRDVELAELGPDELRRPRDARTVRDVHLMEDHVGEAGFL
jgi:hypothetical protein